MTHTHQYNTRSKKCFLVDSHANHCYERILIFDVETTGIPRFSSTDNASSLHKQPYIIQLSYLILEICKETHEYHVEKEFNEYIRLPDNQTIPTFITTLTGITDEMCGGDNSKNMPDVLFEFCTDYKRCNVVVSHNLKFDSKMVLIELSRHWRTMVEMGFEDPHCIFNPIYNAMHNIEFYCTMTNSMYICNLKNAKGATKNPKLTELFAFLFPDIPIPDNLHNAQIDTLVCYYCYLKLTHPELDICAHFPLPPSLLPPLPSPQLLIENPNPNSSLNSSLMVVA